MSTKSLFEHIHKNLPPLEVCKAKGIFYTLDEQGRFHSYKDEPAIVTNGGIKAWFDHGALHREAKDPVSGLTLPAFVKIGPVNEKLEEWWVNDVQHRDDIDPKSGKTLPAEIFIHSDNSYKCWRKNGVVHRSQSEGPAYINRFSQCYMEEGVPHREEDLPAIISTDGKEMEWWYKGKRHREGKPAVIHASGEKEFWVNGKFTEM